MLMVILKSSVLPICCLDLESLDSHSLSFFPIHDLVGSHFHFYRPRPI